MLISRRAALRSFAAFSALRTTNLTSWAHALALAGTGPSPSSILVLVEGPWLITQQTTGILQAISLPDPHQCQLGLWDPTQKTIVSPYDPNQPGPYLPGGTAVSATLKSANPRPDAVATFDVPFKRADIGGADNFVYIRNKPLKGAAAAGDRTLTLPVPDNVYVAGRALNGVVIDASIPPVIENPGTAKLFISLVFEYTQDAQKATALTVNDGSGGTFTLHSGGQLVLQMQTPGGATPDCTHVSHAFDQVVSRIGAGSPPPLSIHFPDQCPEVNVQLGINAQGLSAEELGLHLSTSRSHPTPPKKHQSPIHHANSFLDSGLMYQKEPSCAGGAIVILP